jgi:hypothetical protein
MHGCGIAIAKSPAFWGSIFLPSHAHYLGRYIFILSWCLSLTYGAATEPRTSYALQPYACVTRCALVS